MKILDANEAHVVVTKDDVLELKLLRDELSQPLQHSYHVIDGDFILMEDRDRRKWHGVLEKIISQLP